jgi:hypothetical protein
VGSVSRQTCIPLDDPSGWKGALEDIPHAFAHTWESCRAMAETSKLRTFLYRYEDGDTRIVCPLSERNWKGTTDIVTPYGFSGFAGNGDCTCFAQAFKSFARDRGYVCGYIGLNPLFANQTHFEPGDVHVYNSLYVLDLSRSMSDLFANLSTNRKRQLKNWDQVQASLFEDGTRTAEFFMENFSGFLSEKRAAGVYAFSRETLSRLVAQENVFLVGAQRDGGMSAVSVFAHTPYAGDYLFNISKPEGRDFAAALIWFGARRLKQLGVPWLNLGGGIHEDDGVARFKERFGGAKRGLSSLKQVYQPETYRTLCREAGTDPEDRKGYFPAYRQPPDFSAQQEQGVT